jgi:phage baseplate assembly protein W
MAAEKGVNDFLGHGWRLPIAVDGTGGLAMAGGESDIAESIRTILSTPKGERMMRPEFGSTLHEYVFASNNATTAGLLGYHVRDALLRWEPRIELMDIDVQADPDEPTFISISIGYLVKATNDERNLVYPFYLIPKEG